MNIQRQLESKNIQSEALDDIVHEAASQLASSINNAGMKEQLEFLESRGFDLEEIIDSLVTS